MSNTFFKAHIISPVIRYFGRQKERARFFKAPIIIGGCARSGTSLLLSVLSAHPRIFCFPNETDAFTEWKLTPQGPKPIRIDRMYRDLLWSRVPEEVIRWCEKRPYNVRFIPEILDYFGPKAKFIHIIRDPRAVCSSRHPSNPRGYWVNPDRWVRDVKAGLAHKDHLQVMTLRFEDMILDPEQQIRGLCDFIGEECADEILNWPEHARVRSHDSWFEGISDIQMGSLDKWKGEEHRLRVVQILEYPEMRELMSKLGYSLSS